MYCSQTMGVCPVCVAMVHTFRMCVGWAGYTMFMSVAHVKSVSVGCPVGLSH